MLVEVQVTIDGSRSAVWKTITDIENAAAIISGIEKIEFVEKPAIGPVGLKWRETRMYFGKPATVEKQITDASENEYYKTRAVDGGFVFFSTIRISENNGGTKLISSHETIPQGIAAKIKSLPMVFFKGMLRKALLQDLNDYKSAVERGL